MIKEIVQCDACKRELDREKEPNYYEIFYKDMPGWATFREPHPYGVRSTYQVCKDCIKSLIKKVKE